MAAVEITIADAIVAEINDAARTWNVPAPVFTAERNWLPVYEGAAVGDLKVAVVPPDLEQARGDRSRDKFRYLIVIDFQVKVDVTSAAVLKAAVDPVMLLVQTIHDYYRPGSRTISGLSGWIVEQAIRPKIFDMNRLLYEHTIESWLELTAMGYR